MNSKLKRESLKEADVMLYIAGELDEQKKIQIENLIQADEKNRKIYLELKAVWDIGKAIKLSESIDLEIARGKVFRNIRLFSMKKVLYLYQKIAAFLLLPIVGTFILYFVLVAPFSSNKLKKPDARTINEISVAYGMHLNLLLPDGTKVWLNSGSYFKYPNQFSGKKRQVYLEGEGYFEIVENRKLPFVINTKGPDIVATGTIINVLAYPADDLIETSLIKGKVYLISQPERKNTIPLVTINPGEKVTFHKANGTIKRKKINPDDVICWTKGYLVFDNDSFDEIVKKLSRWYNTEIILTDDSLKTYTYTATFVDETIFQVMELLKLSAPINYRISARTKVAANTFSKRKVEIWMKK